MNDLVAVNCDAIMKHTAYTYSGISTKFAFLLLLLLPVGAMSQELVLEKMPLAEAIALEEDLNSINKGFHPLQIFDQFINENYITLKYQCLRFERVDDDFSPKLHTWYSFDNDSIVRVIKYYWGFYSTGFNPTKNQELITAELNNTEKWEKKYEALKKKIKRKVGSRGKEVKNKEFGAYNYKEMEWIKDDYKIVLTSKIVHSEDWKFDTYVSIQIFLK